MVAIKWSVFVMKIQYVCCEVGIEFINITYQLRASGGNKPAVHRGGLGSILGQRMLVLRRSK